MKKFWMISLLLILLAFLFASCSPASPASSPDAEGITLLETRCTVCHNLSVIENEKGTAEEWQRTVERMIQKGAKLSADEAAILVQYLAETYK